MSIYLYSKKENRLIVSEMEKPDESKYYQFDPIWPENPDKMGFDIENYKMYCDDYDAHLKKAPRLEIIGEHKWEDGQVLVEGKDFRINKAYIPTTIKNKNRTHDEYDCTAIPLQSPLPVKEGRFKMPTDEQIVKTALVFNDGKLDPAELTNMVSMCMFVVDRLYENGDIMIPSSKEEK